MLDVYEITYDGLSTPLKIYVNMYERSDALIPRGLTGRKRTGVSH